MKAPPPRIILLRLSAVKTSKRPPPGVRHARGGFIIVKRRDPCAAALQVESVFSTFAGRLVSRVEFTLRPLPAGTSSGLLGAMAARVDRQAAERPLAAAIDIRCTRRPVPAVALLTALASALTAAHPTVAAVWLQRTLLPWADIAWPRQARFYAHGHGTPRLRLLRS